MSALTSRGITMRVSQQTKERTRQRILKAAEVLFTERGFELTTTRDLAKRAKIAVGTLFNYFPTKEVLALELVHLRLVRAQEESGDWEKFDTLEERLFASVAAELRHLVPYRAWLIELLEVVSSLLRNEADGAALRLRSEHLQRVQAWIEEFGHGSGHGPGDLITTHLYWSLYLGVLSFWARDESRNQESTLALLHQSTQLFCRSLEEKA